MLNSKETKVNSLFFQNEDGSGFIRSRYLDPLNNEIVLLESNIDEQDIINQNGVIDTNNIYYKAINPELILGNVNSPKDTPIFLFSVNENSGYLEPKAIVLKNNDGELSENVKANFKFNYVESQNLTAQFFLKYFEEGDEFVDNFLKPATKDIFPSEKKIRIHLLIVADTLDHSIGKSCAKDMARMIETFKDINDYMGMNLNVRTVCGKNYGKQSLVSELKLLKPNPNDIVVFYYTGHGFRQAKDKRRYPYLDLRKIGQSDYLKESMSLADIYKIIKSKNAKVNLVLSDCCNTYVGAENAQGAKPFKQKSVSTEFNSANIRKLFIPSKPISIIANAADSTQKASSNVSFGGFFSYFFKIALNSNCSKKTEIPTWYQVFNEAKAQTIRKAKRTYCNSPFIPENICNQIPIYNVE